MNGLGWHVSVSTCRRSGFRRGDDGEQFRMRPRDRDAARKRAERRVVVRVSRSGTRPARCGSSSCPTRRSRRMRPIIARRSRSSMRRAPGSFPTVNAAARQCSVVPESTVLTAEGLGALDARRLGASGREIEAQQAARRRRRQSRQCDARCAIGAGARLCDPEGGGSARGSLARTSMTTSVR